MIPSKRSPARNAAPDRRAHPNRRWRFGAGLGLFVLASWQGAWASASLTRAWTTDDGLPHNHIHQVEQDATGFLWLATEGGLVRFDGHAFHTYTPPAGLGQSSQQIRTLVVDPAGGLVVVGGSGDVLRFRDETFSLHPVTAHLDGRGAMDLHIDRAGALWVGTREGVLHRWQAGRARSFGPAEGLSRRGLGFYFADDGAGNVWISAADFLGRFADETLVRDTTLGGSMIQIAPARGGHLWALSDGRLHHRGGAGGWRAEPLPSLPWEEAESSVRRFLESDGGALWFATATAGLVRYADGEITIEAPSLPAPAGLTVDRENNLWVSTSGGLRSLRPRAFQHHVEAGGVPAIVGTSVAGDDSGALWFANRTRGVVRLREGRFEEFRIAHNNRTVFVNSAVPTGDGSLWLAAPAGLFRATTADPAAIERAAPPLRNVEILHRTRDDDLWVAALYPSILGRFRRGAWRAFGPAEGFTGGPVSALVEDAAGALWVGTEDGELFRGDGERFEAVPLGPDNSGLRIYSLHVDPEDALWIGTPGGLIGRRGETIRRLTRADGLPEDFVAQIISDDTGRLWFGGARGYYSAERRDLHEKLSSSRDAGGAPLPVRGYGRDEGLPGISAATRFAPTTQKDDRGRLWFSTPHGVLSLDPRAITRNPLPPPILVDRVGIDGRASLPGAAATRLPAGTYRVEFQFAAPSFTAPERVRLRHRLEGVDPDWVDTPATRSAQYTNLPPGPHRLRVIGANGDGVWNETGATFAFTLEPAWWQTRTFQITATLAAAAALIALAQAWTRRRLRARIARLEHAQAVERERARIARNLHDELGSAITSLGFAVEHLAHRHPSVPLREELGDRVQRAALDLERVVWTVSPQNDSLDRLVAFISSHAERYFRDTPVRCVAPTDLVLPAHPVLPEVRHHLLAVVKEALQNVLKHAHATRVEISAGFDDGALTLSIRDDGIGFDPGHPRRHGHGLANLHTRVGEIGGALHLRSAPGAGTTVEVRVPLAPFDTP